MVPFRYIASGVFIFFMLLMLVVTYIAFTKRSTGVTGLDMTQVQQLRAKN